MSLVIRYPGRACLLGEHCDWAGGASLAVPTPMGIEITVEPGGQGLSVHSSLGAEPLEAHWADPARLSAPTGPLRFVPLAARALAARGVHPPPVQLWVRADLPPGRGFSSSAAFCLGVLDALAQAAGQALDAETLAELAYGVEHDLAGVACGRLDPLACVAGTPVFLQWTDGRARLRRVQVQGTFHFVVGAFPVPRDAPGILATLNRLHDRAQSGDHPDAIAVREAIAHWASLAERATRALEWGDAPGLGDSMQEAQQIYNQALALRLPALAAPLLIETTAALQDHGALGAKFSGAGGDGSIIALFPDSPAALAAVDWLESRRLSAWYLPVSGV